ncbi:MAG: hypothetical protein PHS62_02395 [Patescibacteria group bacterium]|nr:hypothetical protein [Patescibacteria group bacterium]
MREILTLSLPQSATKIIKKRVEKRGFSTVSGYIQYLLDADDELISAEELLKMTKKAERDYKKGKVYKLKSVSDLMR